MQRRLAMAGIAAVAAVTALCANSGCGHTANAISSSLNGPAKVNVGPWATTCNIAHKGIADLSFVNSGGRNLKLTGFTITLKNDSGHALKSRHIKIKPTVITGTNGMGFGMRVTEYVTYAATSCGVTDTLPPGEGS